MNYQELINNLTQAILTNIKNALNNEYKCDKTYKGKVTECIMSKRDTSKKTDKYKVLVNGATHVVSSSIDCNVGDYVWVCAPCGSINNMFIVCKTR